MRFTICSAAARDDDETAKVGQILSEILGYLVNRQPRSRERDVERFGRYLFATLLGNDLWKLLKDLAGQEPIELALQCAETDRAFYRLPWEMMHDEELFLAQQKQPPVSITRRVKTSESNAADAAPPDPVIGERSVYGQATVNLTLPPRVLFVVGTDLGTDVVRPGERW